MELTVAMTIMAIVIAYAVPMFQKAFEQSRVDLAATNLETLWTAQRLYWAQNRTFSGTVADMEQASLLDSSFVNSLSSAKNPFQYSVVSANESSFQVKASRINSKRWHGEIVINEQGVLSGEITGSSGDHVTPSQL